MLRFLRIICIWICCVSCLFGRINFATVAAVPFEYFEDHEQLSYDLDTEQSKAKYDTRMLSEQLLKSEKSNKQYNNELSRVEDATAVDDADEEDDLQPHERAASCYTNGFKYTHGQKVPRQDPCEVCLCMDGEIFCWWEKCAKSPTQKPKLTKFTPSAATTSLKKYKKIHVTSTTTTTTTQIPNWTAQRGKYAVATNERANLDEVGAAATDILFQQKHMKNQQKVLATKLSKKKKHQQQQQLKHERAHEQKQQQHKHAYEHVSPSSSSPASAASKILNFPENLPSVLYYDYKTEEHQHHQHQHHQQHLKHQQQMQQLHKLKQQQQEQQQEKQQQQHQTQRQKKRKHAFNKAFFANVDDSYNNNNNNNNHNIYTIPTTTTTPALISTPTATPIAAKTTTTLATPAVAQYLSTDTDNIYDDSETDSDILPEPPTKKPKFMPSTAAAATATTEQLKHSGSHSRESTADNVAILSTTTAASKIIATLTSSPVYKSYSNQTYGTEAQELNAYNNDYNKNDDEDQDAAFHRWLTSTELNNNRNDNNNNNYNTYNSTNTWGETNVDATPVQTFDYEATQTSTINTNENRSYGSADKVNFDAVSNSRSSNTQDQQQNLTNNSNGSGYFRGAYTDYSSEYNGSVVNIDITLTSAAEMQQQQKQHVAQRQEEQIQQESILLQADLISNPSKTKTSITAHTITNSNAHVANNNNSSITNIATARGVAAVEDGVNGMLRPNKFTSTMLIATPTARTTVTAASTAATTTSSTTLIPEKQCNVMGTLYKIGDVLPQDTGNCLQCVCIDGSTSDDTPRVTCSPHNCPPLVLPDLFDATGY